MVSAMAETKIVHVFPLSKKVRRQQRQSVIIEKLGFKWHTLAFLHQMSEPRRTHYEPSGYTIEFE